MVFITVAARDWVYVPTVYQKQTVYENVKGEGTKREATKGNRKKLITWKQSRKGKTNPRQALKTRQMEGPQRGAGEGGGQPAGRKIGKKASHTTGNNITTVNVGPAKLTWTIGVTASVKRATAVLRRLAWGHSAIDRTERTCQQQEKARNTR